MNDEEQQGVSADSRVCLPVDGVRSVKWVSSVNILLTSIPVRYLLEQPTVDVSTLSFPTVCPILSPSTSSDPCNSIRTSPSEPNWAKAGGKVHVEDEDAEGSGCKLIGIIIV